MTSLVIETTKEGEKKQKSIPYVNPQATDSELIAFAQGLVDLTTQTYESTTLIDKRDLDTDSKLDYSVSIQTNKLNASTGNNDFGSIASDATNIDLNVTPYASGGLINVRLRGLTQFINPYYAEITVNSQAGTVENRSITYCTETYQTMNMRLLWTMDLTLVGTFAVGDSITVKFNVNGDNTYNPYTRTLTYRLIEWTGGEG